MSTFVSQNPPQYYGTAWSALQWRQEVRNYLDEVSKGSGSVEGGIIKYSTEFDTRHLLGKANAKERNSTLHVHDMPYWLNLIKQAKYKNSREAKSYILMNQNEISLAF